MKPPLREMDRSEFWTVLLRYWGSIALIGFVGGIGVRNGGGQAWGVGAIVVVALLAYFFARSETAKRLRTGYWGNAFIVVIVPFSIGLAAILAASYVPRFL